MKGIKILNDGTLVLFSGSHAILEERKKRGTFKILNTLIQHRMKFNFNKYGVHVLENEDTMFSTLKHLASIGKENQPPIIEILDIEYNEKEHHPTLEGFLEYLDKNAEVNKMTGEEKENIKAIAKNVFELINLIKK